MAVDMVGRLLVMCFTPTDKLESAQVHRLCEGVQKTTGHTVQLAWADQGFTDESASKAAQDNGIDLQVVKQSEATKGMTCTPMAVPPEWK